MGGRAVLCPLGHDATTRWLRPDVGQAPRERRDQHVVGAQACWRGRGATRARCRGREAARYWVLAGLGVIGACMESGQNVCLCSVGGGCVGPVEPNPET